MQVYGGTDLVAVPGGFDRLLTLDLPEAVHTARLQACRYDTRGGSVLSRNHPVPPQLRRGAGRGPDGRRRSGVLEQSWRLGGASGAEVAALEIFQADPEAKAVHASCFEVYGTGHEPPPDATVYFQGHDAKVGPLTKYTVARLDDDT